MGSRRQTDADRSLLHLLRLPEVKYRTGFGKSAIYARMKDGTFPQGIKLGPRTTVWSSEEIDAWVADQIRRAQGAAR